MAVFKVDPAVLLAAADRMSQFEQHMEQTVAQLEAIEHQLGTTWDGQGGHAQAAAQQQWTEGVAEMRRSLAGLRAIAEGAHENYHGAAQMNLRNWG
ncbi:WXG100 family type VII secretion target [Mycolicibacterium porcinum]|uniref:ESAT-6-like protein n=1 Tax=Mycolicibacterium porcinum TaxID=39693 RepID=A0AAW5TFR1_9MYCO|nr:WXG100 family type VII secretion target [Mycolicibacterium porcinum]MCV7392430.1 WXG100 family type VII secretion target [Mycolicibacterium porcinum]ORB41141.1 WXG100 family type VII secretion target [Mycolicibacterium porcinum]CDO28323.1 putative ESAT-6-like protein 12 [Mycolicibacterium vulneris]